MLTTRSLIHAKGRSLLRIIVLLGFLTCFFTIFCLGQNEGTKAKSAGYDAFKAKNYVLAINQWEIYFNSGVKNSNKDVATYNQFVSCYKFAALEFIKKKDWKSAATYWKDYFKKGGNNVISDGSANYLYAFSSNKLDQNDVALTYFQKSLDLNYKADSCRINMLSIYKNAGLAAYTKNDYIAAANQWEKGMTVYEKGFTSDTATLKLFGNSLRSLAYSYMNKQEWSASLNYLEKYLQKVSSISANDSDAVYSLAFCANKLGKSDEAITYFLRSVELNYKVEECKSAIAAIYKNSGNEAYRQKDYSKAIIQWEKYMESGGKGVPTDLNTMFLYRNSLKYAASAFFKKQDWASSFAAFEKYMKKGGKEVANDGEVVYSMAYCAFKLGKNEEAITYFRKAIDLNYKPDFCLLQMAIMYKNAGQISEMVKVLVPAIEKYPNSVLVGKMSSMLETPFLKEAAIPFNEGNVQAKKASAFKGSDYVTQMGIACQKFKEAIPLLERVLKYNPDSEPAKSYLKICHEFINSLNEYKEPESGSTGNN